MKIGKLKYKYILLLIIFKSFIIGSSIFAQVTTYPFSLVIENVNYTSGTHNYFYPTLITSPSIETNAVSVNGTAQVTYTAGDQIELNPGFEAGDFTGDGNFVAQIDTGLKMILISPDPSDPTTIVNGVVHVPKWEKFEVGFNLPQEYLAAVTNFFDYYDPYYNSVSSAPSNTPMLNPYADDSLLVEVDLTSPSSTQITKWAFFMRVADFLGNDVSTYAPCAGGGNGMYFQFPSKDGQVLADNPSDPLRPFNWRFRFAPNEEGAWAFNITISNPQIPSVFPTYTFNGFTFICDLPLPENHGFLHVNSTNNKYLQFDEGNSFFGIGFNIPNPSHNKTTDGNFNVWRFDHFYESDFNTYIQTLDEMRDVGANYVRKFLLPDFAIEWDNLGVYDQYSSKPRCDNDYLDGCSWQHDGNRQYHLWAFDKFFEKAHENGIYLQLCIDPYQADIAFQSNIWGDNAYSRFVTPESTNITNSKELFLNDTLRYYWKRRYKYLMSRYGYSVNLAVIETFNEIDQTLNFHTTNTDGNCGYNNFPHNADPDLKVAILDWHDDILDYVKNTLSIANPHLTEVSFTDFAYGTYPNGTDPDYDYNIFNNDFIDITDVHHTGPAFDATYNSSVDKEIYKSFYTLSHDYVRIYNGLNIVKPFHFGEGYNSGAIIVPGLTDAVSTAAYYNNYENSFHNDLWATAFMGGFTTGLTWVTNPVHWWPDANETKLYYSSSSFKIVDNIIGHVNNVLDPSGFGFIPFSNKKIYCQYQRLSEFMQQMNNEIDLDEITITDAKKDVQEDVECYYLLAGGSIPAFPDYNTYNNTKAYGWIHNMNAYWYNDYYYYWDATHNFQNLDGCSSPVIPSGITIKGLIPTTQYYINLFCTRIGVLNCPDGSSITLPLTASDDDGTLILNSSILNSLNLGCDTFNADIAFTLSLQSGMKFTNNTNQQDIPEKFQQEESYNVIISPNPSNDIFSVMMQSTSISNESVTFFVYNTIGRLIYKGSGQINSFTFINLGNQPKGIYLLKSTVNNINKFSKLILQ